jgi:hypothetical protein
MVSPMHPSIAKAKAILAQREQRDAEYAEWRAKHEEHEFYDDVLNRSYATNDFDVAASLADQEFAMKRKSFSQPQPQPQPQEQWVSVEYLSEHTNMVIDIIAAEAGRTQKKLLDRIEKLENELHLVRALARGEIKTIESRRDAKAS